MKKIILTMTALISILSFSEGIVAPKHRIEGDLGLSYQIQKNKAKTDIWQRYVKLGATYLPEWNYQINDTIGLTFGPRANIGVETNIAQEKDTESENLYGIKGGLGAEANIDFKLPQGEVIYLGLDSNLSGVGYVKSWAVEKHGMAADLGLSVGGKIGEKVKLGARFGYEFEGLWKKEQKTEEDKKMEKVNNFTVGIRFGYLLGN